jgi:hypothetical protein
MDYENFETTIDNIFYVIVAFRWSGKPYLEHRDGERLERTYQHKYQTHLYEKKILSLLCSPLISSMYSKLLK